MKKCVCLLSLTGCLLTLLACQAPKQDINDPEFLHIVESNTGLSFPADTKWLGYHLIRGMDYFFAAAIEIPKNELTALVKDKELLWDSETRYVVDFDHTADWFNPNSIPLFQSVEVNYPKESAYLRMLYGKKNNTSVKIIVLYIIWFEMS